jgi:hypothetical protein
MIHRRDAMALLAGLVTTACTVDRRGRPTAAPGPQFAPGPIVDWVPAAGLIWLVDARPRDLFGSRALGPAIATVVTDDRVAAFARRFGGVDPRKATELAVAGFAATTLGLARMPVDPAAFESAFAGATRDRENERAEVFAHEAVAVERGRPGPLQAAVYFAEGRLRRALPALKAEPLSAAASRIGEAPFRCFCPGPFEGRWASGVGGLMRAATAVAGAARPWDAAPGAAVALTLLLLGAWASNAPAAEERLAAAFNVWSEDPLGRLTGIDRPIEAARTASDPGALRLDVVLDPAAIARGLRDATDASIAEIMAE